MKKVTNKILWLFAIGQLGWSMLSGIVSNWLVFFYMPEDSELDAGQKLFITQGSIFLGLTVIGVILMFNGKPGEGVLQASGLANFKYYTVLTNVYCGLIALIYLICLLTGKGTEKMIALKLGAVCGVAITFAVVAFMFGPLYGFPQFYK